MPNVTVSFLERIGFKLLGQRKSGELVYRSVKSMNGAWNASKGAVKSVSPKAGGIGGRYDIITTDYAIFDKDKNLVRQLRRSVDNLPKGQHSTWMYGEPNSVYLNSKQVSFINNTKY